MDILTDVDLCLVDTDLAWLQFLQTQYYEKFNSTKWFDWGEERKYNLHEYFTELSKEVAWSFWDKKDLYDNLVPKQGSYEALKSMHDAGHRILVTSYCKGGHLGSKYRWVMKNFPFVEGFLATKEKHLIRADIFIDDRHNMLNKKVKEDSKCLIVKFDTQYQQEEELLKHDYIIKNWKELQVALESTIIAC